MKLKVLPLEFPYNQDKDWWEECLNDSDLVEPVFNRDGLYFDREANKCWIEIKGQAWKYPPSQFKYDLECKNHILLTDSDRKALEQLIRNNIIKDRKILEMFYLDGHRRECRDVYRCTQARTMRYLKEQ